MKTLLVFILGLITYGCIGQSDTSPVVANKKSEEMIEVGGRFENRDFMFVDMPRDINSVDTTSAWGVEGTKLLIKGKILMPDAKTPASDVIFYYYHTNTNGIYPTSSNLNPKVARHGYLRGWVKSDKNGEFSIYTIRPGSYPNSTAQAHIHPSVKEPNNLSPYYLDEIVFDDDPFVTDQYRRNQNKRGGSGIIKTVKQGDILVADYKVVLGMNIPGYPDNK